MSVDFRTLQKRLRQKLFTQIAQGRLTGLELARESGFQQAHISNFLNQRRGLSLEAMDQIMAARHLSVLDLLTQPEINSRAQLHESRNELFRDVPLVEGEAAATQATVGIGQTRDIVKFKSAFLEELRADDQADRGDWQRFVAMKLDAREGMSMYPRLLPNAVVLIDRRYNSLIPYRKYDRNMYVVRSTRSVTVGYVEQSDGTLLVRPHNPGYSVEVLPIEKENPADLIVGRICHVSIET